MAVENGNGNREREREGERKEMTTRNQLVAGRWTGGVGEGGAGSRKRQKRQQIFLDCGRHLKKVNNLTI